MPLLNPNYVISQTIVGESGPALDVSGILYDLNKDAACPGGFKEVENLRETWSNGGDVQRTERYYLGPFSAGPLFRQWALGYANNVVSQGAPGLPGTGAITRVIPAQDPRWPYLYCAACELVRGAGAWIDDPLNNALGANGQPQPNPNQMPGNPQGVVTPAVPAAIAFVENLTGGTNVNTWNDGKGLWRLTFTNRRYRIYNDGDMGRHPAKEMCRMLEIDYNPTFEGLPMVNVYGSLLKFTAGPNAGNVIKESGVLIVPGGTAVYRWHEVPDPPFDLIDSSRGTVNSNNLYAGPGRKPFAPGVALFHQPTVSPWTNCAGRVVWDVVYRFGIRPVNGGWNGFPDPAGGFNPAAINGVTPVYASTDHNQLFQVGPPVDWRNT